MGGALADWQIVNRIGYDHDKRFTLGIDPFVGESTRDGTKPSYGLTSYGYDLRLAPEYKLFDDTYPAVMDPCDPESFKNFRATTGPYVIIPPNSFVLGRTVEYIRMPEDCIGWLTGKSTYARNGVGLPTTPIEPGWEGHITLEIANHTRLPVKVYADAGIAQLVFIEGSALCHLPYNKKPGALYQGQRGITPSRVPPQQPR